MPAASAAVIYFIRTAVISRLPEPGQRQLLSALATAASHAIAPPVIVAAMEGCGVLLELLGACVCVGCHEAAGAAGGPAVPREPKNAMAHAVGCHPYLHTTWPGQHQQLCDATY